MDERVETIIEQYRNNYDIYHALLEDVEDILNKIIKKENVKISSLTFRVKQESSLLKKIHYKNFLQHIDEVTDVVAFRIITLFESDVDILREAISSQFEVVEMTDRRKKNNPYREEYGYNSVHLIVKFSDERCKLIEYQGYENIAFEIQLRSALQHAWCEIEHGLGYKSKYEIPAHIRRRLNRLSATLELLDEEFESINKEIAEYNEGLHHYEKILKTDLNYNSLVYYCYQNQKLFNLHQSLCKEYGFIDEKDSSIISTLRLMKRFHLIGFGYIHELDLWVNENIEKIIEVAKVYCGHHTEETLNYYLVLVWIVMAVAIEEKDEEELWEKIQQTPIYIE